MVQVINYEILIETTNRDDQFKRIELSCEVREELDDNGHTGRFTAKVVSEKNLEHFFGDQFNSELLNKLSVNKEYIFSVPAKREGLSKYIEELFSSAFGKNYRLWVYPVYLSSGDAKWLHADGLGDKTQEFDNIKDYKGLGGIEFGDIEDEVIPSIVSVPVFYATDRKRTGQTAPNEYYGGERNTETGMEMGICEVSIPNDHKLGEIEKPSWWRRVFFEQPESPELHVTILKLTQLLSDRFLSAVNLQIEGSTSNDALIFIHGYNVEFSEAVKRTAQLSYDLSFEGAAITYSWPSRGTKRGYMADEDAVVWTVPHLKATLKNVLKSPGLSRLHLIAHSMGNRALTKALQELNQEKFDLNRINQVILAAPDIDSQIFTDILFPAIKGLGKQITLYASSKDKALIASRVMRTDIQRAGESGENLVILEGLDTVDASMVDTDFLGHGYFAETKELLTDLHMTVNLLLKPKDRMLQNFEKPPRGTYWRFPA